MRRNFRKRRLKILFAIRAVENFMYMRSIVENLERRGHEIDLIFDKRYSKNPISYLNVFKSDKVSFRFSEFEGSYWRKIFYNCQDILSWRRYFKVKGQSDFYQERWKVYLPLAFRVGIKIPVVKEILTSEAIARMLKFIVDKTPVSEKITNDLLSLGPDVICATPANMPFSSCDQEYLRASKRLGIPSVVTVFSWDNLTTKGLLHVVPDLLLVWNKRQIGEFRIHHGINPSMTKVTGAYLFDFWYGKRRVLNRESFCKAWGLDHRLPILLYLGTSDSLVGDERWLVRQLREELNKSANLKKIQLVVRPHPFKNSFVDFSLKGVFVIPKHNTWPDRDKFLNLYFSCIDHSFAVVGVNTSGFIDAAILDKPTIALRTDKYQKTQVETEHFRQLLENGVLDLVQVDSIGNLLSRIISGLDIRRNQRKEFVQKFIRPNGLGVESGKTAALEIEKLAFENVQ